MKSNTPSSLERTSVLANNSTLLIQINHAEDEVTPFRVNYNQSVATISTSSAGTEASNRLVGILEAQAINGPEMYGALTHHISSPAAIVSTAVALIDVPDIYADDGLKQTHTLVVGSKAGDSKQGVVGIVIGESGKASINCRTPSNPGVDMIHVNEKDELVILGDIETVKVVFAALQPYLGKNIKGLNLHDVLPQIREALEKQERQHTSAACIIHALQPRLMAKPVQATPEIVNQPHTAYSLAFLSTTLEDPRIQKALELSKKAADKAKPVAGVTLNALNTVTLKRVATDYKKYRAQGHGRVRSGFEGAVQYSAEALLTVALLGTLILGGRAAYLNWDVLSQLFSDSTKDEVQQNQLPGATQTLDTCTVDAPQKGLVPGQPDTVNLREEADPNFSAEGKIGVVTDTLQLPIEERQGEWIVLEKDKVAQYLKRNSKTGRVYIHSSACK